MSRRLKDEDFEEAPALLDQETYEENGPVAEESHRVVRTWKKKVPVDQPDDEEETTEAPIGLAEVDGIAAAVMRIGGSDHNWSMIVSRLKNYHMDNRTDTASRKRLGTLPIASEDYIEQELYIDDIQRLWAIPGLAPYFHVMIRCDNRNFKGLPVIEIEPYNQQAPAKPIAENPGAGSLPYQPFQQAPPAVDPFKQMMSMLKQANELRDTLLPPWAQQAPPAAAAPTQVSTAEQALLFLANADGQLLETASDKIKRLMTRGGGDRGETTVMDIILAMAQKFDLQGVIREARALVAEAKGQPVASNPPSPSNSPPQAAPTQPGANLPQQLTPEVTLLNFTLSACNHPDQWPPVAAAAWIANFEEQNPSVTNLINTFIGFEPQGAIEWIKLTIPAAVPVVEKPHALQWIAGLQDELRKFDDGTEGDDAQNP